MVVEELIVLIAPYFYSDSSNPNPLSVPVREFELPRSHWLNAIFSLGMIEAAFEGPEEEVWRGRRYGTKATTCSNARSQPELDDD